MTELAAKIKDSFSDMLFEIQLFMGGLFKKQTADNSVAEKDSGKKLSLSLRMLRMTTNDRLFFFDQMATLIGSGVTLIDSLSLVQAQTTSRGLKQLYAEIIHEINTGLSLADAMYKFPHVFPRMQSALVEAAERSGNLKVVLNELVTEMEADQEFKRKITGAMFYPVVLLVLALGMVIGMMIFVIPRIATLYKSSKVSLPALTQAVIDFSGFVTEKWPILLIGTVGTLLLVWLFFTKWQFGRMAWENIIAALPVVGKINKEKNLMIICSNMAMLMKSGVLISEAFEITENTINNLHYQQGLADIRKGVIMGTEMSKVMGLEDIKTQKFIKNSLFPIQMAQLIHIGESTGRISEMFIKLRENYNKSLNYTLKNISTLVEPLMIFLVALIVGTILMAVMLPFFNIGSVIR